MYFSSRVGMNRSKQRIRRRAFTLVETLAAAFILVLLVIAAMSMFGTGSSLYAQTSRQAYSEADVARASRTIEDEISQACDYTVSADGKTLTYYLLTRQVDGKATAFPPTKNATARSFTVQGASAPFTLKWSEKTNPILTGLPSSAVFGPVSAQPSSGIAAILTATLVSEQSYSASKGAMRTARQTAVVRVFPRNVASLFNIKQ